MHQPQSDFHQNRTLSRYVNGSASPNPAKGLNSAGPESAQKSRLRHSELKTPIDILVYDLRACGICFDNKRHVKSGCVRKCGAPQRALRGPLTLIRTLGGDCNNPNGANDIAAILVTIEMIHCYIATSPFPVAAGSYLDEKRRTPGRTLRPHKSLLYHVDD